MRRGASKLHLAGVIALALVVVACPGAKQRLTRGSADQVDAAGRGRPAAVAAAADADAGPPTVTLEEICGAEVAARAPALPGKKPFSMVEPHCTGDDPFCDQVERSPDPKNACFVANDNLARAERQSRQPGPLASAGAPWDGTTRPKYLDRVDAHLHLTAEEHVKLKKNGFVVLDRFAYTDYATAFHDVFQQQLPLFVGVDPILHAVFRGTELALERTERRRLVPALTSMLTKLRRGLATARLDAETRRDLDTYLGVAWGLSRNRSYEPTPQLSVLRDGDDDAIAELVRAAEQGSELTKVTLFGRERMIDFSQLVPRGHYTAYDPATQDSLEAYFRAVMWLSRVELNIVSRSSRSSHPGPLPDPSETPREVRDALALAELVERTGASVEVRAFEEVYSTFAGRREDIPPAKLLEIARKNGVAPSDPAVADKVKAAIGDGWQRTARTHFTVDDAPVLPAITTLLGPRIVPDVAPLTRLVHDAVPNRFALGAADVGYVLGHDRARSFVSDLGAFPSLVPALAGARDELRRSAMASTDVYGMWLKAILALGDEPTGVVPSFVRREAYADHRLNSALVGYGQLRHTFVLLTAQGYDTYGCEIPDAYVEPLPAVYDALRAHVRAMRTRAKGWEGLDRVLGMLASIAHTETDGRALTEAQRRWLAMVSEYIPLGGFGDSTEPPKWTGWYFDMFEDREHGATKSTSFIADYFTLTTADKVAYLGAEGPRLGVFVVDTNGEPRVMVGPVAKGFEAQAPIAGRLDDEKVFDPSVDKRAPWRASYAADRPDPPLGMEAHVVRCDKAGEWRVAVRSARPAGRTSVTLLDHHGDPLTTSATLSPDGAWAIAAFDLPAELAKSEWGVEAFHLRVEDLARAGAGKGPFDVVTSPSHFTSYDGAMPERPRRTQSVAVGLPGGPSKLVLPPETPSTSGPWDFAPTPAPPPPSAPSP